MPLESVPAIAVETACRNTSLSCPSRSSWVYLAAGREAFLFLSGNHRKDATDSWGCLEQNAIWQYGFSSCYRATANPSLQPFQGVLQRPSGLRPWQSHSNRVPPGRRETGSGRRRSVSACEWSATPPCLGLQIG